jgi:hypothetical protein
MRSVCRSVFQWFVDADLIVKNPVARVAVNMLDAGSARRERK